MNYELLVFCLLITIINSAPLLLMPAPWTGQTGQMVLQQQLMELQALRQLTAQSPVQMYNQQQPVMILVPNQQSNPIIHPNEHVTEHKENEQKDASHTNFENDDDLNSIVIDAASENNEDENQAVLPHSHRTILLIPNARLSIGGIISAIPWLPIEINVPDTISWAYNGIVSGIGSIISIIGRPFGTEAQVQDEGLKSVLKQMQPKQNMFMPIVMMPIDGPVLPIQV